MASIVDLCEGVRDALNNETFGESFDAVFEYAPAYTIPDTDTLRVVVTDAGGEFEVPAKRLLTRRDTVRIVILWQVGKTTTGVDTDMMKRALDLLQEISDFLFHRGIGEYKQTGGMVRGDGEKDKNHYFPANLDQGNVFASDLRVDYVAHTTVR